MKLTKFILAGVLTAGAACVANAQTVVNFTGSTAYRANAVSAIEAALGGAGNYTCLYDSSASNEQGATHAIISGTIGGTWVFIRTSWSGSEAGVQSVDQDGVGIAQNYLPTSVMSTFLSATTTNVNTTATTPASGYVATSTEIPDITFADTFQASSHFYTPAGGAAYAGHTYAQLNAPTTPQVFTDGVVGVVPFVWLCSNNGSYSTSSTISSLTSEQAVSLYKKGYLPISILSGNSADSSKYVFATGRNLDSGTRLTSLAECGFGALNLPKQYQPSTSGSAQLGASGTSVALLIPFPADNVDGIAENQYNSGYSSGGSLGKALGDSTSSTTTPLGTGCLIIGPIGTNDVAGALPTGATTNGGNPIDSTITPTGPAGATGLILNYNGVPYTASNVESGRYTFWGYEHIYFRAATGGFIDSVASAVASDIYSAGGAIINLTSMAVGRTTDGANVTSGANYLGE